MVDLTFRLPGPWGAGKGSNLQPSEVDNNFWSIAQALVDLESNPAQPVGIESITVSGTQMTIYLTDGSVMGPFTMPVLTFRWRGEWLPTTDYAELDVFTVLDTGIFTALLDHTSGATFDPDIEVAGEPALQQLFGSTDMSLSGLGDVTITEPLADGSALLWDDATDQWVNVELGSMALQDSNNVDITGGQIHGMPTPTFPGDVATKAYVDALPAGMTIENTLMMANISGTIGPALPVTLSNYLDYVLLTTERGTLLYRSGSGWLALAPGTSGQFLKTLGSGVDPVWAPGGSGVTSITAGAGIDTTPDTIIASGTVALAAIADDMLLANTSGASAAPVATTLTAFLDSVLGIARGTILTRTIAGWVGLAPGTNGYYLKTQGSGADAVWDAPAGSGTVTSISAGTGISTGGSPITGSGTVSLAAVADGSLLANTSGGSAAPVPTTGTLYFDRAFGTMQGAVLYRSATAWVMLTPGTSGQFLATGGTSANPTWQNAPTTGAAIPSGQIISNISGISATPIGNTLTNILDAIVSSARGTIIYRSSGGWLGLAPGTAGQFLRTGGTSGDPSWATAAGGGGGSTDLDGLTDVTLTSPATYDQLVYDGSVWRNQRPKYVIACYVPGLMTSSQGLLFHRFSKAVTLPPNLGAYLGHTSEAAGSVAATASAVLTIAKAASGTPTTFSDVATVTFAAAAVVGTFASGGIAVSFAQGDILWLRGPASPDATLADAHVTIVGYET